jgi:hypothetical protein
MGFAYINMLDQPEAKIGRRRRWMNYWGGLVYRPKIKQPVDLGIRGLQGVNMVLPLDQGNWPRLREETRQRLVSRVEQLLQRHQVTQLAADRREKKFWQQCLPEQRVYFGDLFLKLLALVMIQELLSRQSLRKLIFVGQVSEFAPLLEYAGRFDLPLSLQNPWPAQMEPLQYQLLYQKGVAVSNSQLRPQDWERQDLVVAFSDIRALTAAAPRTHCLLLDDKSFGLAPMLEARLSASGLQGSVAALAPIMESYLLGEKDPAAYEAAQYDALIQAGKTQGLWLPFLDNCS